MSFYNRKFLLPLPTEKVCMFTIYLSSSRLVVIFFTVSFLDSVFLLLWCLFKSRWVFVFLLVFDMYAFIFILKRVRIKEIFSWRNSPIIFYTSLFSIPLLSCVSNPPPFTFIDIPRRQFALHRIIINFRLHMKFWDVIGDCIFVFLRVVYSVITSILLYYFEELCFIPSSSPLFLRFLSTLFIFCWSFHPLNLSGYNY